ncbi:MAG: hypothetical protein KJ574_05350, partial [Nanoarchaeota archaeon]|nr:hypothetical protein [Nanoarchaeota archaeon]
MKPAKSWNDALPFMLLAFIVVVVFGTILFADRIDLTGFAVSSEDQTFSIPVDNTTQPTEEQVSQGPALPTFSGEPGENITEEVPITDEVVNETEPVEEVNETIEELIEEINDTIEEPIQEEINETQEEQNETIEEPINETTQPPKEEEPFETEGKNESEGEFSTTGVAARCTGG